MKKINLFSTTSMPIGIVVFLLMLTLGGTTQSFAQCFNNVRLNATGGVQAGGADGISIYIQPAGAMQIIRANTAQIYINVPTVGPVGSPYAVNDVGTFNAIVMSVGNTSFGSGSGNPSGATDWTVLYNTCQSYLAPSGGLQRDTLRLRGVKNAMNYDLNVYYTYQYPANFVNVKLELTIPVGNTEVVKLGHGFDTYLDGGDAGPGFISGTAPNLIVGVNKNGQIEAFRYKSGVVWSNYFSSDYTQLSSLFSNGGALSNVINTVPTTDNGIAVQMDMGSTPGTFTTVYDVIFTQNSFCNAGTNAPTVATTLSNSCPTATANLGSLTASNTPANTVMTWHTGTPATDANVLGSTNAVGAGVYYAAFYDALNGCYSGTNGDATTAVTVTIASCCPASVAPALSTTNPTGACGAGGIDLSTISASNTPGGQSLTWHTATPATSGNRISSITSVAAGTYYAAFFDGATCFGATSAVTASIASAPAAPTAINDVVCAGDATTVLGVSGTTGTVSWYDAASAGTVVNTGTSYIFTPTGSAVFYVEQDVASCPSARTPVSVTYNALPTAAINPSATTICSGNNVTLTASGGASYAWSNGDLTASSVVSPAATASFTVTVTDGNGCVDTDNVSINVNTTSAAPTVTGISVCTGNTATLTTASAGTIEWYDAATAGTLLFTGASFTTPALSANTDYYVQADAGGCPSARTQVTVSVTSGAAAPTAVNDVVCAGDATTVLGVSGTTGTVSWYDAASAGAVVNTGTSYIFTPTGSAVFYVEQNVASCPSARTPVSVTYNALPTAAINATSTTICSGNNVTLTASGGASYAWSNGDVTAASVVSPAATASFTVTVTDGNGCVDTDNVSINVNTTSAAPTAAGTTICTGNTATLTTASAGTIEWYDAATAGTLLFTGASFTTPALSANTDYYVQADAGGCPSARTQVTVSVTSAPAAPTAINDVVCAGDATTVLGVSGTTGTVSWYDAASAGAVVNTGTSYIFTPTGSAVFYVEQNVASCPSARTPVSVTYNALPTAAINASSTTICSGNNVTLTASGGASYAWSNGDVTASSVVSPASTATFTVTVTDSNGCVDTDNISINVNTTPAAPTAAGTTICDGNTATLTTASAGTIEWYDAATAGTLLFTGASFTTPVLSANTDYYVLASVLGCPSARTMVTVSVTSNPTAPTAINDLVCAGNVTTVLGVSGTTGTVSWYNAASAGAMVNTGTSYIFTPTGSAVFYVEQSVSSCPSARTPVSVTYNALPTAAINPSSITICSGNNVTLTASGGASYAWSNGDVTAASVVSPASTASFTVTVTDGNGCVDTDNISINVNTTPAAPTAAGTTICDGNAVVLNTVVAGVVEWFDAASAGNLVNNGATFITPVLNADATYFVQVTSAAGCPSARTQVNVTVNSNPATPVAVNETVCFGQSTSTLGVTGGAGTFNWYTEQVAGTWLHAGANFVQVPNTSTTYYVDETLNGCTSLVRVPVVLVVNALPTPSISGDAVICAGNSSTLNASGGASYVWSNGDVNASIIVSPSANATYQLTATNAGGCTATAAFAVVVLTSPNAAISATGATTFCAGGNVTLFTANGSQFYNWSTGSNASSVQASTSGTYSVTVTSLNGCTATASQVVTVNPVPQALITPSGPTTFCSLNGSVDLVASGGGTYAWSNGSSNASINVTNSGQFIVTVTANVGGCTATANVPVTVIPTPAAPTASNTGAVCAGAAVSFNASTLAGADYLWSGPAGFSTTQQSFTLAEAATANAGAYSVAVTLAGCTSLPGSTTLVVNTLPTLTNAPSSNSPVCEGGDLSLNADNVAGVSYAWRGPNGFNSSNASVTITNVNPFDHSGFYNLLITDNATGCEAELPYIVVAEVNPQPTNIAVLNNGPICNGESIVLTAPNVLNATYLWSGPNGFTSTSRVATATAAAAGSYNVVVSVGGCASVPAVTDVVVNPLPNIVVSNDTSVAYAAPVHLLATGGLYYEWNAFTFLSNANIPNPVALPPVGVMSYTVTGYNEFACANTAVVNITVTEDLGNTDVPNLITPNGDGTNDTWVMPFLQQITGDYTLNIYARGGTLVYSSSAYANDWGGTMEGTALPDGAYWYIIRTVDKEYKGAITVKH